MLRRLPFLARLASRYALRHKAQTTRAILGLLVATIVLSTGLGMGESIATSLEEAALAQFGQIDIVLRSALPFDVTMANTLPQTAGLSGVRGAASMSVVGSVLHPAAQRAEAFATIRGVGAEEARTLGPLAGAPEPGPGQVVLSQRLANRLAANIGDRITLRAPDPGSATADTQIARLVGASGAPQPTTLDVRADALGLGAEISWTVPGPTVTLVAISPSGIEMGNTSASSPLRLVIEPPLETGTWSFRVTSDIPTVYAGGAGVAYLPADLSGGAVTIEAQVIGIAKDEGRAAITGRPSALLPLSDLQRALGARDLATVAYYHSDGDPHRAVAAMQAALPADSASNFTVTAEKADRIDRAKEAGANITGFLLVMGGFTLLAASLLAFTLFSALVEERRAELGIARALGLTRGEVAISMTMEGALYAIVSALVGLALGIALLFAIFAGIDRFAPEGAPDFSVHVSITTLVAAFLFGCLIPLGTIGLASLRFARLDPARAIRGIPDDPRSKRNLALGFAITLTAAGALLALLDIWWLIGIPLIFAGLTMGLIAFKFPKLAILPGLAGAAHILWSLYSFTDFPAEHGELEPITTLARGAILALGLSALAVASPRPYLLIARQRNRPAFIAAKYIVSRRRPVGLTMAMISLVVVIVTVMGTLFVVFGGTIPDEEAGYAILGQAATRIDGFPRPLPRELTDLVERADFIPSHIEFRQANITRDGQPIEMEAGSRQFLGATQEFAEANEYELADRPAAYASDREAWLAVARGDAILFPDWALDLNDLHGGDRLTVQTALAGERDYIVAGGVRSQFAFQTWLAADHVRTMGFPSSTSIFVRVPNGADPNEIAHRLAAAYSNDGLTFTSIPEEVATALASVQAIVLVFEGFLALGLFVGLAATGFLASRAVHERMRDIGTLRALGFEEKDVHRAFVLESTLTAAVGLLIGTLAGVIVAHSIWWRELADQSIAFRPPWLVLTGFAIAVLLLAAFAARGPAKRAAALPPAIAVRHVE